MRIGGIADCRLPIADCIPLRRRSVFAFGCALLTAGCIELPGTTGGDDCSTPGVICTVAGTGQSLFNGDGMAATATGLYYPLDVTFDPSGLPLILDWNNLRLRRINADGTIQTVMGQDFEAAPLEGALAIDTALHHASDVEPDAQSRLYVAGDHAPVVFRVDLDDRVHVVAGSGDYGNDGDGGPALDARLSAPFGVAPSAEGGVYIADFEAHVIRYVDPEGVISTIAGNGTPGYAGDGGAAVDAEIETPTRLTVSPAGDVVFCDTGNHAVRRVTPDGIISTIAGDGVPGYSGDGGPASLARLDGPHDLRYGSDGALYIADTGNHVIRRIDENGVITTVVGNGAAGFDGDGGDAAACTLYRPSGVNFDAEGAMWIADTRNNRVRKVAGFLH